MKYKELRILDLPFSAASTHLTYDVLSSMATFRKTLTVHVDQPTLCTYTRCREQLSSYCEQCRRYVCSTHEEEDKDPEKNPDHSYVSAADRISFLKEIYHEPTEAELAEDQVNLLFTMDEAATLCLGEKFHSISEGLSNTEPAPPLISVIGPSGVGKSLLIRRWCTGRKPITSRYSSLAIFLWLTLTQSG